MSPNKEVAPVRPESFEGYSLDLGIVGAYRVAWRIYRDVGMIAPFEDAKLTIFLVKLGVLRALLVDLSFVKSGC
jgi:hypothetical protein